MKVTMKTIVNEEQLARVRAAAEAAPPKEKRLGFNEFMAEIGGLLRGLRDNKHYSPEEISAFLGSELGLEVKPFHVRRFFAGKSPISDGAGQKRKPAPPPGRKRGRPSKSGRADTGPGKGPPQAAGDPPKVAADAGEGGRGGEGEGPAGLKAAGIGG
jgi:hypothetical protein